MTVLSVSDYLKAYDTNTSRLAREISKLMMDEGDEDGITRQTLDNWIADGTGAIDVNIASGGIMSVKRISTKVFYDRGA